MTDEFARDLAYGLAITLGGKRVDPRAFYVTHERCHVCGGSGSIEFAYGAFSQIKQCDYCEGRGWLESEDGPCGCEERDDG